MVDDYIFPWSPQMGPSTLLNEYLPNESTSAPNPSSKSQMPILEVFAFNLSSSQR